MNLKLMIVVAALVRNTPAQEPTTLTPEYLDGLRASVRAEHPSVAAGQARIRAAEADVRAVRLWEDPMVGLGVMAADADMRRDDGDIMFSVEQVLPRRKLYEAEKTKMRAQKSIAAAELESTAVKLETFAAQTAIELALADEMIAIGTNQIQWLDQMAVNARERLKAPTGNASEALRMISELAHERQKFDSTVRTRRRVARQLNILLGRPADQPWLTMRLPESAAAVPVLETELAKIAAANPMLQALTGAAQAARSDIEIAKRGSKPKFSVGIDSRVYSGGDFREASVGAKMTIPLFNRSLYRANIARAQEHREAAEKQAQALGRELESELATAFTDAENAAHHAMAFSKEVIPRAEQAAESTQNAWISSQASLLEVLEARRAVSNARLEERRFIAAQAAALEKLRSIVPPKTQP